MIVKWGIMRGVVADLCFTSSLEANFGFGATVSGILQNWCSTMHLVVIYISDLRGKYYDGAVDKNKSFCNVEDSTIANQCLHCVRESYSPVEARLGFSLRCLRCRHPRCKLALPCGSETSLALVSANLHCPLSVSK